MGTHPAPAAPDLSFRVRPVGSTRVAVSSLCTSDQSRGSSRQTNVFLRRDSCSTSPGFPTDAIRTGADSLVRSGIDTGGIMYTAFRIKKPILSATIVAALLFAAGSSTRAAGMSERAIAKPHAARLAHANGTTSQPVDMSPKVVTVGKIEIPAVGIATRVLEGDDARILRLSVGHIPGTAVPGPSGNVGLAGHNTTFFRPLRKVSVGNEIRYSTTAGTFTYRVVSLRVVLPSAIEVLNSTPQPTLTLVTCYPFNSNSPAPQRLIVHAEMVAASPN
jgi:LPXTG-site transpeptidase (sortase) family protein